MASMLKKAISLNLFTKHLQKGIYIAETILPQRDGFLFIDCFSCPKPVLHRFLW